MIVGAIAVVIAALAIAWLAVDRRGDDSRDAALDRGGDAPSYGARGRLAGLRQPGDAGALFGRVVQRDGDAAIAGAVVAATRVGSRFAEPLIAIADASGAWRMDGVPPGIYAVTAAAPGFLPARAPRVAIAAGDARELPLALRAGGVVVSGRVDDIGGGPIANATVELDGDAGVFAATTGADGAYRLGVPVGDFRSSARHDAYATAQKVHEVISSALVLDWQLVPAATVHGVVIARDTGRPVPHASVSSGYSIAHDATTGDDGAFTLTGLQPGIVRLRASARGYVTPTDAVVSVGPGGDADGVTLIADPAFGIRGRVVDERGAAIAGATVTDSSEYRGSAPTGSDGAFELVGVTPDEYYLVGRSADAAAVANTRVRVVDRDVTGVVVTMAHGATLSGRVEPAGAATLHLIQLDRVAPAGQPGVLASFVSGTADDTGAFSIPHVLPGAFRVEAEGADGARGALEVHVGSADRGGLVISLDAHATIRGRVVDTAGAPVAGRLVFADHLRWDTTTGPNGAFVFAGLDAGTYDLTALVDGFEGSSSQATVVLAAGGEGSADLVVPARDGAIHGRVVDGDDRPVPGALVHATDQSLRDLSQWLVADDAGAFELRDLVHHMSVKLVASDPNGSTRVTGNAMPGATVTLRLARACALRGRVLLRTGEPAASYSLHCSGPEYRSARRSSGDGTFELANLEPGAYTCTAESGGQYARAAASVAGPTTLDLQLAPAGSLTGTLVDATGAPVPDRFVVLRGEGFSDSVSDHAGRFALDNIPYGTSELRIRGTEDVTFTLAPGQHLDLGTIEVSSE